MGYTFQETNLSYMIRDGEILDASGNTIGEAGSVSSNTSSWSMVQPFKQA
jgi:hypothetical protein